MSGWLDKLKEYAPSIVGAIASGGATLPQLAFKALSDATGVDIKTEDDAKKAVDAMSPSQLIEMKKADQSFEIAKIKAANELAGVEIKDVQHAREQNKHSVMPALICCYLTMFVSIFVAALMYVDIPIANQRMIDMIFGSVLTAWLTSVAYWVGTTRSSAEKSRGVIK